MWGLLAALVLAWPLNGCGPSGATPAVAAELNTLELHAGPGDSLTVVAAFHSVGQPDSIIWSASSRLTATARKAYRAGSYADSLRLIPSPALADGDTLTVSSCLQVATRRTSGVVYSALKCQAVLYTKPGAVFDSLRVISLELKPKGLTLAARSTQQFCTIYTLQNGARGVASNDDPACLAQYGYLRRGGKAAVAAAVFEPIS